MLSEARGSSRSPASTKHAGRWISYPQLPLADWMCVASHLVYISHLTVWPRPHQDKKDTEDEWMNSYYNTPHCSPVCLIDGKFIKWPLDGWRIVSGIGTNTDITLKLLYTIWILCGPVIQTLSDSKEVIVTQLYKLTWGIRQTYFLEIYGFPSKIYCTRWIMILKTNANLKSIIY